MVFNENVVPEFGFYYAQTLKSWLYGESSATTLPIINKGKFQQAPFPLAPIAEQREIVAELEKQFSRLDEAVANLKRVKANLKRYKASVLKDAVEGRSFETGEQLLQRILEVRRSQWKGKGKFKEPVAPDVAVLCALPAGWGWATYAQVGDVTTGFTPPTGDIDNFGGSIPFFKPSDLDVGENVTVAREYLSALAHSACLLGKPRGYLVFGIADGSHAVVGTAFDPQAEKGQGSQLLPLWLALVLQPNVGFEIHSWLYHGQRVVLFEVHPAFDRPVKFYGTAYVRNGSSKTELGRYSEKERTIWNRRVDWSAQVCEQATLADLDPLAIAEARRQYAEKNKTKPDKLAQLAAWDDGAFLNKAKLTVHGAITHAALLLLGREESSSLLAPAVARISWILKNKRNEELDYEHFGPPLQLNVDKVLGRIRNLTVRELPDGTLFPVELTQYGPVGDSRSPAQLHCLLGLRLARARARGAESGAEAQPHSQPGCGNLPRRAEFITRVVGVGRNGC